MSLDDLRARIDAIDEAIVALLVERAGVAVETAHEKAKEGRALAYDPVREQRVLERVAALAAGKLPPMAVKTVFREIMSACLAVQRPITLALAQQDAAPTGSDRTVVAFELEEGPGALRRALGAFDDEGVSLRHIESHPSPERPWAWVFVAELAGHRADAPCARALARLAEAAVEVRVLGSFDRFVATDDGAGPRPIG